MIYIDVDGVIADYIGALLAVYNQRHGTSVTNDDVKDFFMESVLKPGQKWEDYSPDYKTIPVLPWAHQLVAAVRKIGKPYAFLSALLALPDGSRNILDDRRWWLDQNFACPGDNPSDRLVVATRKDLVVHEGDLLIEDGPMNVEAVRKAGGQVLVVAQPWNTEVPDRLSPDAILWILARCR